MRKNIVDVISVLLIILFCYAAVSKILDFEDFKIQLSKSPLLTSYAPVISWIVPVSELFIALLLVFKSTRLAGLYLSLAMMVMFTAYIIIILNFSYYIPCSCGGVLQGMSWKAHLVFNLFFVVIATVGIAINPEELNLKTNALSNHITTGEAEHL